MRFDADRFGRLALGLEGGHSVRRVVHAGGSATGRRVVRQLSALAAEEPLITVLEGARAARALWSSEGRCRGLICEDGRIVAARAVVLGNRRRRGAVGAHHQPARAPRASGLLLAHAAGAALADLELLQFHPTAVIGVPGREGFLVTEAIRGEGATLHDAAGERFVDELAPRDEVSRAIQARLEETGAQSVGLDMRAIDPAHFPNVVASLREAGLDPMRELIPVAPAAHYTMGGIVADLHGALHASPGCMPSASPPARACTAPTAWRPIRCSECFVFARRAVAGALSEPAPRARRGRRSGARGARARLSRPSAPRPPPARRCGGTPASSARAEGLNRLLERSPSAGQADRALRADAHREPRRAPALGPPRARSRRSTTATSSSPIEDAVAWQTWA